MEQRITGIQSILECGRSVFSHSEGKKQHQKYFAAREKAGRQKFPVFFFHVFWSELLPEDDTQIQGQSSLFKQSDQKHLF